MSSYGASILREAQQEHLYIRRDSVLVYRVQQFLVSYIIVYTNTPLIYGESIKNVMIEIICGELYKPHYNYTKFIHSLHAA